MSATDGLTVSVVLVGGDLEMQMVHLSVRGCVFYGFISHVTRGM